MAPPEWMTLDAAHEALENARLRATVAGAESFAIAMDQLLEFAFAFGIKVPDRTGLVAIYRDALRLPSDLLDLAVSRAVGSWTWGNRLPMPAELRQLVSGEIFERERDLMLANAMAGKFAARGPETRSFARPILDMGTPISDEFYRKYPHLRGRMLKNWPDQIRAEFVARCITFS